MIKYIVKLFHKYERHISSGALILGFIVDSLTLRRIDLFLENAAIVGYLLIVAISIIFFNLYDAGKLRHSFWGRMHPWFLICMQFAVGGLFSAFLVFYSRSASFVASWPFLLILLGQMIANEMLRNHYARLTFQIGIFFFALFSYSILIIPVLLGQMGWWVFLLSGIVSLVLILLFCKLLARYSRYEFIRHRKMVITAVISLYILINILYFTNIIPPIPLALQEVGIYNNVSRLNDGSYNLVRYNKQAPWWKFQGNAFNLSSSSSLYAYSSVFGPTRLNTSIAHEWQYFDREKARWITSSRITFPISGGRENGFRGYSMKENIFRGDWRVNVETSEGRLIGRIKFKVI